MPKVGRCEIDYVLRQDDGQVFAASLHQEGRDRIVLVAGQAESICLIGQAVVEALEGDFPAALSQRVLVRLHQSQDLLRVELAFELGDHDDEARVSRVIFKLGVLGTLFSMTCVLHDDSFDE